MAKETRWTIETEDNLWVEATPMKRNLIGDPLDIQIEKVRVEVHMTMDILTGILGEMTEID